MLLYNSRKKNYLILNYKNMEIKICLNLTENSRDNKVKNRWARKCGFAF